MKIVCASIEKIDTLIALLNDMQKYTEEEYNKHFFEDWKEKKNTIHKVLRECHKEERQIQELAKTQPGYTEELHLLDLYKTKELTDAITKSDNYRDSMLQVRRFAAYLELPKGLFYMFSEYQTYCDEKFIRALEFCILDMEHPELHEYAVNAFRTGRLAVFPMLPDYQEYPAVYGYDETADMWYGVEDGIKMFFPKDVVPTEWQIQSSLQWLHMEQDEKSPHRYLNERMEVPEGAVVIDAGVAEGNFSVSVIEKAKKNLFDRAGRKLCKSTGKNI